MRHAIRNRTCPNTDCRLHGQKDAGNIIRHGFIVTKRGRTRRYRCNACGTTTSSSRGTPYFWLQHSRNAFDHVAAMCVEGVSKSSIARIMKISWNTVARWEERAAAAAREFNCILRYSVTGWKVRRSRESREATIESSITKNNDGRTSRITFVVLPDQSFSHRLSQIGIIGIVPAIFKWVRPPLYRRRALRLMAALNLVADLSVRH
jgi:transposase-like protein